MRIFQHIFCQIDCKYRLNAGIYKTSIKRQNIEVFLEIEFKVT